MQRRSTQHAAHRGSDVATDHQLGEPHTSGSSTYLRPAPSGGSPGATGGLGRLGAADATEESRDPADPADSSGGGTGGGTGGLGARGGPARADPPGATADDVKVCTDDAAPDAVDADDGNGACPCARPCARAGAGAAGGGGDAALPCAGGGGEAALPGTCDANAGGAGGAGGETTLATGGCCPTDCDSDWNTGFTADAMVPSGATRADDPSRVDPASSAGPKTSSDWPSVAMPACR